jgi:hypothetical protein
MRISGSGYALAGSSDIRSRYRIGAQKDGNRELLYLSVKKCHITEKALEISSAFSVIKFIQLIFLQCQQQL